MLDDLRRIGRVEVGVEGHRQLLSRGDEARHIEFAERALAMRQLGPEQHLGIEPEAIGLDPALRAAIPGCQAHRLAEIESLQLRAGIDDADAVERMGAPQFEHTVEQGILDPVAVLRGRRRGGLVIVDRRGAIVETAERRLDPRLHGWRRRGRFEQRRIDLAGEGRPPAGRARAAPGACRRHRGQPGRTGRARSGPSAGRSSRVVHRRVRGAQAASAVSCTALSMSTATMRDTPCSCIVTPTAARPSPSRSCCG